MANDLIKRLRYFTGQFLEEADFQAEQSYHIGHRRRANQILWLKAGILDNGFEVKSNPNNSTSILVTKGVGVDQEGRELVRLNDWEVSLPQAEGQKVVVLSYDEEQTDQQFEDQDVSDNTRWQEVPQVSFADDLPKDRSQLIVLALVQINADGELASEPDLSVRQIAAARLPGDLTIGQDGSGTLHTRHIDGKDFSSDAQDHLFLNYATNKDVYLGYGNGSRSSLYVSGKIGVGTQSPNARLEIDMQTTNDVALRLVSSGPGWGSGIQFQNTAAGAGRSFGIYSNPQGELHITDEGARESRLVINSQKQLRISGVLMPSVGNNDSAGILFPLDPGGGSGDKAFIRYFAETGETTKLLIGCDNDIDDRISFQQLGAERLTIYGGNIGIGTTTPSAGKLQFANEAGNKIVVWDGGPTDRYGIGLNGGNLNAFIPAQSRFSLRLNGFDGPEKFIVDGEGRIGIGTTTPSAGKLQFANEAGNKIVVWDGGPTDRYGIGLNGGNLNAFIPARSRFSLRLNGFDGPEKFIVDGEGRIGIGTTTPSAGKLQFANELGNKIVVWDGGPNDRYGIGLNGGNLNAFVPELSSFSLRQNGSDQKEVFSVRGNGSSLDLTHASPAGPRLLLRNPTKTAVGSEWAIYNMTGEYSNSLQFWNYDNNGGSPSPRLIIQDNGDIISNGGLRWNNAGQVNQRYILLGSLLICWGVESILIEVAETAEGDYKQHRDIVYPLPFSTPPAVSTSLDDPCLGTSVGSTFVGVLQAGTSGFKLTTKRIAFPLLGQLQGVINVGWIAIGPS
jgi:hypothetical protein